MAADYPFTNNTYLYNGYANLVNTNCSQESIDKLRISALKQGLGREHILGKWCIHSSTLVGKQFRLI